MDDARTRCVLVPIDYEEVGESIVWLHRLRPFLQQDDVWSHLITVIPPTGGPTYDEAKDRLTREVEVAGLAELGVVSHVRVGEPALEILNQASGLNPVLIAMATHGRRGVPRWRYGSVTERVLRNSRWPVLTAAPAAIDEARGEDLGFKMQKVLVPLDGSTWSNGIVAAVGNLLGPFAPTVVLQHVAGLPATAVTQTNPPGSSAAEAIFHTANDVLTGAGLKVETRVDYGDAAEQILKVADQQSVDCIAMTTHGRSGFARWVYGSVAEKVLRAADRPVLTMRPEGAIAGAQR